MGWLGCEGLHFRVRAIIFDHTVQDAISPTNTSRAPGFATQECDRVQDSNAAPGNTQDIEATPAFLESEGM